MKRFLGAEYGPLKLAAVRTLALQNGAERTELLTQLAGDSTKSDELRVEAIAGLASTQDQTALLKEIAEVGNALLAREAERVLRLQGSLPIPKEKNHRRRTFSRGTFICPPLEMPVQGAGFFPR